MSSFNSSEPTVARLGACIRSQASQLGVEHIGATLENVVARIAKARKEELAVAWDEGVKSCLKSTELGVQQILESQRLNPYRES